jgi:hypothetical protein
MANNKTEGAERPVKKIRRRASPKDVHQLYDAISHWTNNVMRQQATMERIQTYMKGHFGANEGMIHLRISVLKIIIILQTMCRAL